MVFILAERLAAVPSVTQRAFQSVPHLLLHRPLQGNAGSLPVHPAATTEVR
jgi:hypothetical protein